VVIVCKKLLAGALDSTVFGLPIHHGIILSRKRRYKGNNPHDKIDYSGNHK